jgi:hypothetical protein
LTLVMPRSKPSYSKRDKGVADLFLNDAEEFVTGRSPAVPLRPLLSFARSVFPPIDGTGVRDLSADGRSLQQALAAAAVTGSLVPAPRP